jgi:L-ascorbate metabolism protein UlaG (beta-lactamase superfamily)
MYITWHGLHCVRLQTKEAVVLIDPLPPTVGLQAPRLQADCFLFSDTDNPQYPKAEKSGTFTVATAGEYEVRGLTIHGKAFPRAGKPPLILYTIEGEGMKLGHLGGISAMVNGEQSDHMKDVDLLFLPVGGKPVLSAKQAMEFVSVLEPRVVIPIYYRVPKCTVKLDGVEPFLKELGAKGVEPQDKIRIAKRDLPEEDMQVYLLRV